MFLLYQKKSINKNVNITKNQSGLLNSSVNPSKKAPKVEKSKLKLITAVGILGIPATPITPSINPVIAVPTNPKKIAAGTFFAKRISVSIKPNIANKVVGSVNVPNP